MLELRGVSKVYGERAAEVHAANDTVRAAEATPSQTGLI
jgi:hypothetical protein